MPTHRHLKHKKGADQHESPGSYRYYPCDRQKIEEEKDFLTELDNVIGDGDHGINMARGFQTVLTKLDSLATDDIGNILKTTGMALVSTVGGASGPLYGTAFMKAGALMAGKTDMSVDDFLACLDAAVEGVKMRGRSTQGEKPCWTP